MIRAPTPGNGAGQCVQPHQPVLSVGAGSLDALDSSTTSVPQRSDFSHAPVRWRNSPLVAERRRWLAHRAADYAASGEMPLAWHALYTLALIAKRQAVHA